MVNMGDVELSLERKVLIKCEMGNVRITEYLQRNYKNTQYHL